MLKFAVVIPARYESSRLQGKPLIKIAGKEMLIRTWEQTVKATPAENVWIATDDVRIEDICKAHGAQVLMTSADCLTGTDRLCEFALKMPDYEMIINVQGDEPIIDPEDIKLFVENSIADPESVLNGYATIKSEKEWRSRTIPKVVFDQNKNLLYMSRSPIPGNKSDTFESGWKQVCLYSFPRKALIAFGACDKKTDLEAIEDIEILRFLELGYRVKMIELSGQNIAVDTLEDLGEVTEIIMQHGIDN